MSNSLRTYHRFKDESWSTLFKTAIVRLPRAVPIHALRYTIPEGPRPVVLDLPSRDPHRKIPLYIFVPTVTFPPVHENQTKPPSYVFPVVVDFHGGGFYLGSCLEQAPFCAKLSRELQAIVISVDYRLAPLDKFPAAIEDADDVALAVLRPSSTGYNELRNSISRCLRTRWHEKICSRKSHEDCKPSDSLQVHAEIDVTRIAFSGASSGGNIALNMAMSVPSSLGLPDWPSPIPASHISQVPLLLLYPSLDLRQLPSERFRNDRLGPLPEHRRINIDDHLAATYVSREMAAHPRASPGLVDVSTGLHKQAKVLLILTGIDTLWEQSEVWVERVKREGRGDDMKTIRYENRKHGWTTFPEIALTMDEKRARLEVLDECVRFTMAAWQGGDPVKAMETGLNKIPEAKVVDDIAPEDQPLAEMLDMGFDAQSARLALDESNQNTERAVAWLLKQAMEYPEHE